MPDFINIRWLDFVDIFLVAFLIYHLYRIVKGTVAIKIFIGIISIYLMWKVVEALKMDLLTEILGQFIGVGVIALIIVFQQELRRFLLLIGTTGILRDKAVAKRLFTWKSKDTEDKIQAEPIAEACFNMSAIQTGALIVVARSTELPVNSYGDKLDADLSSRLLESIFFKNSPMHDGAVIVAKNKIAYARCVLPVTEQRDFPSHLGMRHRSAVGITEVSGAVSISVSEQTGEVSFCKQGKLTTNITKDQLIKHLVENFG